MSSALKQTVHSLVDNLPEEELPAARRYLEFLRAQRIDPYAHLDAEHEIDDEERAKLRASVQRGLDQMNAGQGRPADEVLAELRSRV